MDDNISLENKPKRIVILDVVPNSNKTKYNNGIHKRRSKKTKIAVSSSNILSPENLTENQTNSSATIELHKVITAARNYGKQTYAAGAMRAVSTLEKISLSLKILAESGNVPSSQVNQLLELISMAEDESRYLIKLFCNAYSGD